MTGRRAQYLGQCDRVRRRGAADEARWQEMMRSAREVPPSVFLEHVELAPLLDEDETPEAFVWNALTSDPTTSTYESVWGDRRCWFLQTAGFEFIFVEGA